jgi:hypothetical protein
MIYSDPTVLPPENQTKTNRQVLNDFNVPPGHRVISRGVKPICIMGYGLTLLGAEKLLHRFNVESLKGPLDIEMMVACDERTLRCLEVNPALIGVYRAAGPASKNSDIAKSGDGQTGEDNPMGPRSVRALMKSSFGRIKTEGWLPRRVEEQ